MQDLIDHFIPVFNGKWEWNRDAMIYIQIQPYINFLERVFFCFLDVKYIAIFTNNESTCSGLYPTVFV